MGSPCVRRYWRAHPKLPIMVSGVPGNSTTAVLALQAHATLQSLSLLLPLHTPFVTV